jgi:arylsulfatase A-like enzyme
VKERLKFIQSAMLASAALLWSCQPCETNQKSAVEVILLISIDTLRADYLGVYGHPYVKTPHIDDLAQQGIRFTKAFTVVPTTLASHTSMMTGTFPHTHGVPHNGFRVSASNQMLPEILKAHGYRTIGFTGGYPLHERFGFAQGFDEYRMLYSLNESETDTGERLTNDVLEWAKHASSAKLFLFVHYWDVHAPYYPPDRFNRMYRTDGLELTGRETELNRLRQSLQKGAPQAFAQSEATRRLYAGEVSWTDTQVGRLLDGLDDRGLLTNSLVILTSDHGEAMDTHPREYWNHGFSVYDESTRIPLIIKLPSSRGAGAVVEGTVSNIDILPTLLDMLQLPIPEAVEGRSFAKTLNDVTHEISERPIFSEATKPHTREPEGPSNWKNAYKCRGLWTADWKLQDCPHDGYRALYDRTRDPNENNNLLPASDPKTQSIYEVLARRLAAWSASASPEDSTKDEDPTVTEQLRALGYVE